VWCSWAGGLASAPRSRSVRRELARASMLAAVPSLGAVWLAVSSRDLRALASFTEGALLVPSEVAAGASSAIVVLLVAAIVRLRGQAPAETDDDPLLASDHLFVPWSVGALVVVGTTATVLGLEGGDRWWLTGACLGIALTVPVLLLQWLVYLVLRRRPGPLARRLLLLLTIGPVAAVAVPLLSWTVYSTHPRVVLREHLGRPIPVGASDVRFEDRHFDFFESRWHCSFVLAPGELESFVKEAGLKPATRSSYARFFQDPMDGGNHDDELSLDPVTGRVHYRWRSGGGW
jgi:hypothetical protein